MGVLLIPENSSFKLTLTLLFDWSERKEIFVGIIANKKLKKFETKSDLKPLKDRLNHFEN
jgi:hypothetical protein